MLSGTSDRLVASKAHHSEPGSQENVDGRRANRAGGSGNEHDIRRRSRLGRHSRECYARRLTPDRAPDAAIFPRFTSDSSNYAVPIIDAKHADANAHTRRWV